MGAFPVASGQIVIWTVRIDKSKNSGRVKVISKSRVVCESFSAIDTSVLSSATMAKKRTADGKEKPQQATATARKPPKRPRDALDSSNQAPPGGQHPATSSKASETQNTEESAPNRKKKQKRDTTAKDVPKAPQPQPSKPQHQPARKQKQKQPRLPDSTLLPSFSNRLPAH